MTKTTSNTIFKFLVVGLSLALGGCGLTLPSRIIVHAPRFYFASTADGWRIAVHRFRPRAMDRSRTPILLVTSPDYNASFWSLSPNVNFANYLSQRGWDVWAISFRGTGRSTRPGYTTVEALIQTPSPEKRSSHFQYKTFDWTLDDYISQDLPSVLKLITQMTGHKKITCIGEGLGGSILLAYMETDRDYVVDRAVVMAPVFKFIPPVPDIFTRAFSTEAEKSSLPHSLSEILSFNRLNIDPEVESACTAYAMESIPPGVLQQIRDLVAKGELMSSDKKRNYYRQIKKIRRPILLISGKRDNLAPSEGVLAIYNQIRSKRKDFREFGKANFYREDYGHDDLILGKRSKKEVYPYIEKWLNKTKS